MVGKVCKQADRPVIAAKPLYARPHHLFFFVFARTRLFLVLDRGTFALR